MNLAAVKHYSSGPFCYSLDEDFLEINILTGKDVDKVFLTYGDPFEKGIMGGGQEWRGKEIEIFEKKELQVEFRWTVTVKPEFKRCRYYFRLLSGSEEIYLLETGFYSPEEFKRVKDFTGAFCFPWMNSSDVTKTPSWTENTVWYQIFPARFARGKIKNEAKDLLDWGKLGEEIPKKWKEPRYGGNLQGIIDKLDYLKELGITGIYMTPINLSSSQHKYNTDDYEKIDPEFGDEDVMKELCLQAHKRNIKIMLDGVFNHSGFDFPKWQDVFKNGKKSKYADWFMVNDFDFIKPGFGKDSNSGRGKYYTFAFADYMPKLNTNNPEVRKYFIDVCKSWIQKYDIDGLRLDVANEISHTFCKELRSVLDGEKKDFYIVGEIWHNAFNWLSTKEFDATMNYPLQNAIADFCIDEKITSKEFEYNLNRCFSMYYRQTNRVLFNQMDSHDTIRILNRAGKNKNKVKQTLVLLFSMPGSVCIYYGTEIFLEGGYDPDNRRCMPWKEIDEGFFEKDINFTKRLIELRKTEKAFISDKFDILYDDCFSDDSRFLHYVKESGSSKFDFYFNCGKENISLHADGEILLSSCYKQAEKELEKDGFLIVKRN